MSKNASLRKELKKIINNERVEKPRRSIYLSPPSSKPESVLKNYDLRTFFQGDLKKSNKRIGFNSLSRDVSHLQDRKIQPQLSLPILPTDLEVLKKLQNSEITNFQIPFTCRREDCIDSAFLTKRRSVYEISSLETIEKQGLGRPTGRQDIKELNTWFNSMLDQYKDKDIDSIMLIYDMCAQELIRQVSVQCVERGDLLKVLMSHQPSMYKGKHMEMKQKIKELKKNNQKVLEDLKNKRIKEIDLYEQKIKDLEKENLAISIEKKGLLQELADGKKKFNDMVRKYTEEVKIWKNKHHYLLGKTKRACITPNDKVYQLSVAYWKEMPEVVGKKSESSQSSDKSQEEAGDNPISQQMKKLDLEINEYMLEHDNFLKELLESTIDVGGTKENLVKNLEVPENAEFENPIDDLEKDLKAKTEAIGPHEVFRQISICNIENPGIIQKSNDYTEVNYSTFEVAHCEAVSVFPNQLKLLNLISCESSGPKENSIEESQENPEFLDVQSRLISMITPKSGNSKKLKRKSNQKFQIFNKKTSKDTQSKKEQELQQQVDLLTQKLQEKTNLLLEYTNISRISPEAKPLDKLKFGIASLSQLKNSESSLSPRFSSLPQFNLTESIQDIDEVSEDTIIPAECDLFSWKLGYSIGVERGIKEGFREGGLLGIERNNIDIFESKKDSSGEEESDPESKLSQDLSPRSGLFSLKSVGFKKRTRELTKIIQFQFNRPLTLSKKQHPLGGFLTKLHSESKDLSKCTLSKRTVNRMMHLIYMNCLAKIRNGDIIDNLSEHVYNEFYQKYGLKQVSDKRFSEFLVSLNSYSSYRRVKMFLRFLGCSGIDTEKYSKYSFLQYLSALQYMLRTKIGIVVVFDENSDKQMFPLLRGIECLKEKILDKNTLFQVLADVQENMEIDNKGANPDGLIELEMVLEKITEYFEAYQENVSKGVKLLKDALGWTENIGVIEFLVVVRQISAENIEFFEENGKNESKKFNFFQAFNENKEFFTSEDVENKCREYGMLKIDDVHRFCQYDKEFSEEKVLETIYFDRGEYESTAKIIGNNGKMYKSLDQEFFLNKLDEILNATSTKDPYLNLLSWKIWESEAKRVKFEFLCNNS